MMPARPHSIGGVLGVDNLTRGPDQGEVTGNTSPEVLRKAYRLQSESREVEQVDRSRACLDGARSAYDAPEMRQSGNVTADAGR